MRRGHLEELGRPVLAELLGTAFLVASVIGSGIAAQRLSPGETGLQLLESSTATGAALVAIIAALGPMSGAHLNPLVTLVDWSFGGVRARVGILYCAAQLAGGATGAVVANLMFGLPALQLATRSRWGAGLWTGEVVATFGLVLVIFGVVRARRASVAPLVVGAYIAAAYWFTSSTSFANPAVTLARTLSDTFAGIAPASVLPFLGAQLAGALLAAATVRFLYPDLPEVADQVVVPHPVEVTS
jgi:glycerol uptake facilitator-like aquaporin